MALTAAQLADLVEKAKLVMGIADDDDAFATDAFAVYHDESATATAATVAVTSGVVTLVVTGGANAGTYTYDTSTTTYDTLTEVVAAINAASKGFVATLLGRDSADATLLLRKATTSCFGQANEQTLRIENNELLELLITNIFDAVETTLGRDLLSTDYSELYRVRAFTRDLVLKHPDVTAVGFLGVEKESGLKVKYTGTDTHARVEVTDTSVVLVSRVGATTTTTTTTFAAQVTTAAMATTLNAVSGWTATVVNSRPSAYLVRRGVQDAKDTEITLEVWDDWDGTYSTDYEAGVLEFAEGVYGWHRDPWMRVDYTAGYTDLPADIEQVILNVVKQQWDATKKDATVESERLGDYAYKINTARLASEIDWRAFESVLSRYRRVLT